jgi:hypothetical protein
VRALLEFASGQLAWLSDDLELAEQHYRTGLQQVLRLGDRCAIAEALEHWGLLHVARGRPAHAARLFAAASALRRQIGAPLPPIDHANVENGVAAARNVLGAFPFEAAWEDGESQAGVSLEQVVAMALENS